MKNIKTQKLRAQREYSANERERDRGRSAMNEIRKMAHIHSKAQNLYQCCTGIFDDAKSFPMRKISLDDDDNDDDEAS